PHAVTSKCSFQYIYNSIRRVKYPVNIHSSLHRLKVSIANELAKYIAGDIALTPASVHILVVDCIHIRIGHLDDFFFRCLESIALFNVHLYSTSITPSSGMPVSLLQISVIPLNIFNGSFSTSVSESRHSLILAEAVYAGNMPLGFSIKVVTPLNSVFSVSSSSTSTVNNEFIS